MTSEELQEKITKNLMEKLSPLGSTLYSMTWKAQVTPAQRLIFRLRASVLRTSDNDSTSWPTLAARDYKSASGSEQFLSGRLKQTRGKPLSEEAFVQLTGWPTPNASNVKNAYQDPEKVLARKAAGRQSNLQDFAAIAGPMRLTASG